MRQILSYALLMLSLGACAPNDAPLRMTVVQSSASGDRLKTVETVPLHNPAKDTIELFPDEKHQSITGFGGAFTESTAHLLMSLTPEKRAEVISAYFGDDGACYSLTRTHINSCDFSLGHYSYVSEGDTSLASFTIAHDRQEILPVIHEAQAVSPDGFRVLASPWTAPPWMKTNNAWYAGKLKPEYYPIWAAYFRKYAEAFKEEGVEIWGFTVENEPLGNDSNWESMLFTPQEIAEFVKHHLGPELRNHGMDQRILVYDQNRGEELKEWAEVLLTDPELAPFVYGTAVHWYTSTVDWMAESLEYTHNLAPAKHILHTEGCVDAEIPHWQDDAWYWSREATDWGWDWAKPEDKPNHPKYVPVYRYARDIIGCLNAWVKGWIDWNMVLDRTGGPNHASNWCIAPVIVDTVTGEVYYTPLYDVMVHFSKFIRPEAQRIGWTSTTEDLMVTSVQNKDGSIVLVVLNMGDEAIDIAVKLNNSASALSVPSASLQTIHIEAPL